MMQLLLHLIEKVKNPLIMLGFFFLFATSLDAANFQIESKLSKGKVRVGEKLSVNVSVIWPKDRSFFQIERISPPESPNLKLIHARQMSASVLDGEKTLPVSEHHYIYEALEKGEVSLSSFALELRTKNGSVLLEKGESLPLRIVNPIIRYSGEILFILIGVFLLYGGFRLFAFIKKMQNTKEEKLVKESVEKIENTFEIKIQEEIAGLKSIFLSGEQGRYFLELRKILAKFIEKRFDVSLSQEGWEKELQAAHSSEWYSIIHKIDQIHEDVAFAGGSVRDTEREQILREIDRQFRR